METHFATKSTFCKPFIKSQNSDIKMSELSKSHGIESTNINILVFNLIIMTKYTVIVTFHAIIKIHQNTKA